MTKFPLGQLPFVLRFWWLWELLVFILVGYWLGFLWALGLILLGSLIGFLLVCRQGSVIMKQLKANPMQGVFTLMDSVEHSLVLVSGFLFMVPGFLTDIVGLVCLIPVWRRKLIRKFMGFNLNAFSQKPVNKSGKSFQSNTIEGEYWRDQDK